MARKPPTDIPKLVTEIVLAVTPIIFKLVSEILDKRGKAKSKSRSRTA